MSRVLRPKEVLFINQDSGYLMIDIVNSCDAKGIRSTLAAGRIVERNISLNSSVRWIRIIKYRRNTTLSRITSWLVAAVQSYILILFRYRNAELFIVSNPPLAPILPLLLRNRFSLMIFDVYPDALVEFGIISRNSLINRFWSKANRKVFARADRIYTLTEGMKELIQAYVSHKKIEVVPLWTHNDFLKPVLKNQNPFIKEHQLQDKFVVMYSGNFGRSHQVDTIVDLAACITREEIVFVFIGQGEGEQKIIKKIKEYGLVNCMLLPWQEPENLPYSLAAADLSIVSLGEHASKLAVPSKLFNFMSVGAPVLCMSEPGSELESLVTGYNIGKSFSFTNRKEMTDFIMDLFNDRDYHQQFRDNSLRSSLKHSPGNVELIRFDHDL